MPRPTTGKRPWCVSLWVTPDERREIERLVRESGLSISGFVLMSIEHQKQSLGKVTA